MHEIDYFKFGLAFQFDINTIWLDHLQWATLVLQRAITRHPIDLLRGRVEIFPSSQQVYQSDLATQRSLCVYMFTYSHS